MVRTKSKKKFLSTTALAKELQVPVKGLFQSLQKIGFIKRENDQWELTELGRKKGGTTKKHPQHGAYIAWDEALVNQLQSLRKNQKEQLITVTAMSKHFNVSKFRMNPILSELGLIEKNGKGWTLTKLGKAAGGRQFEYDGTGVPYVCWEESILTHKSLLATMKELEGEGDNQESKLGAGTNTPKKGFREKFKATHRAADGHYVRSRGEMLIDNWLYMSEIVHAYERKLPIEEDVYSDFYLPVGKVYIEYWGLENDPKYQERKQEKLKIYEKYGFNLIEIQDADIQNLDDVLPKKLLKFGITVY